MNANVDTSTRATTQQPCNFALSRCLQREHETYVMLTLGLRCAHVCWYDQRDLNLLSHWQVNGAHYGLTSEAWLQNMDKNEGELLPILGDICANEFLPPSLPTPFACCLSEIYRIDL